MMMFLIGMLTMWVICGIIVLITNSIGDEASDVKDFLVGGFIFFPFVMICDFIRKKC